MKVSDRCPLKASRPLLSGSKRPVQSRPERGLRCSRGRCSSGRAPRSQLRGSGGLAPPSRTPDSLIIQGLKSSVNDRTRTQTNPALAAILKQLIQRAPIFHRPEFGTSRVDFEQMTTFNFWETGASGKRYSREYVLEMLEDRHKNPGPEPDLWETSDFYCQKLAENIYLLTYTLLQPNQRRTRRSTIWQHTNAGWKIVYHQGTIIQDA